MTNKYWHHIVIAIFALTKEIHLTKLLLLLKVGVVGQPKNYILYFFFANSISLDFSSVNVYFFYLNQDIGSDIQTYI